MNDIHLQIHSLAQLFDSLDPAPFREKALDRDADAYLLESAREYPRGAPLRIVVHGPASLGPSIPDIATAVRGNFSLSLQRLARMERFRRRIAWRALALGLAVLGAAIFGARALSDGGWWAQIASEGLVIVGWVGLWRPAEALLFEWVETSEMRAVLGRLATIPVEFVPDPATAGGPGA